MRKFLFVFLLAFSVNCFALEGDKYNDISQFENWTHILKTQHLILGHAEVGVDDLKALNKAVNTKIKYYEDYNNTWQLPADTKANKRGDCKDFATLKFYELAKMGINPDDMLIVEGNYYFPGGKTELHAVLQVKLNGNLYVLDNRHGVADDDKLFDAAAYYKNKFHHKAGEEDLAGFNDTRWTRKPLEE